MKRLPLLLIVFAFCSCASLDEQVPMASAAADVRPKEFDAPATGAGVINEGRR